MNRSPGLLKRNLLAPLVLLGFFAVTIFVFFIFPPIFIPRSDIKNTAQRLTAQNDVRTTALQALGGIVAICVAYVAYLTWKQNRFSSQEQRLADLVKELGSDHSEVRLTVVDGLGRLARESKPHSHVIGKVLTEWVKRSFASGGQRSGFEASELNDAIDVLRRLNLFLGVNFRLDFAGADLRGVNLRGVDLSQANLSKTLLDGVDLATADLSDANIVQASLRGSIMFGANMTRVDLSGADLEEAVLDNAKLVEAKLADASFKNASLQGATLMGASLVRATLEHANCQRAVFKDTDCLYTRFTHADVRGADFTGATLDSAQFADVRSDASTTNLHET